VPARHAPAAPAGVPHAEAESRAVPPPPSAPGPGAAPAHGAARALRPPVPAAEELSGLALMRAFGRNALVAWAGEAYREELVVRRFLGVNSLLVNAPEGIRRVLVDNPGNYRRTPATVRVLRPLLGDGLFLAEGEAWRRQRRIVAPSFAPRATPMIARTSAQVADETVAELDEPARAGRDVDLLAAVQSVALEVAGRTMMSLEMARHRPGLRALVAEYRERLGRPVPLDFLLPLWLPGPHDLMRRGFRRRWMARIEAMIADRRSRPPAPADAPRDLFDILAAARDPDTGAGFTDRQLRDQVATLITAGHETTALALFWSLTLLAQSPAWQDAVAAEAAAANPAPEAAADALPGLPVTRAVFQEAVRLYPPAYTVVRQAIAADTVAGVTVGPGWLMVIAPWVLHRHHGRWDDPDAFDPARFLPPAPPPDRFAYLPFGAGPRVCIGAQFAMTEGVLVLARLVRAFRIELADDAPVLPVAIVTVRPDRTPVFRLTPRS